jgi:glycosyltransferase involved in cell wall biosynthesis
MLMRKPYLGRHSIERLFDRLCEALPPDIAVKRHVSSFTGRGISRRILITLEAVFHQGDVTHVTGETYFLTLLLRRRTTVLTIHDLLTPMRLTGPKAWLMRLLWYRLPMARAQVITVVSEATRKRLAEFGLAKDRDIRVIYNCTFSEFKPVAKEFDATNPLVLLVGTTWNKNVERVIEALSEIRCRVRLIGEPSVSQQRVIQRAGLAVSTAYRLSDHELVDEYARCDLVVMASTEEGFGLPILEAQATGRVVVTSRISSMPEVAGDAAEFVDPFSVTSIRRGVQRVIADAKHRETLIARGFENLRRFSPQLIADQYAAIYRELAGSSVRNLRPRCPTATESSASGDG